MTSPAHISIMDHDGAVRDSMAFFISTVRLRTRSFTNLKTFHAGACSAPPAIALLEMGSSDTSALAKLGVIRSALPNMALILMTGDGGYLASDHVSTAGALAVLEKPFDPDELLPLFARAFDQLVKSAPARELARSV